MTSKLKRPSSLGRRSRRYCFSPSLRVLILSGSKTLISVPVLTINVDGRRGGVTYNQHRGRDSDIEVRIGWLSPEKITSRILYSSSVVLVQRHFRRGTNSGCWVFYPTSNFIDTDSLRQTSTTNPHLVVSWSPKPSFRHRRRRLAMYKWKTLPKNPKDVLDSPLTYKIGFDGSMVHWTR